MEVENMIIVHTTTATMMFVARTGKWIREIVPFKALPSPLPQLFFSSGIIKLGVSPSGSLIADGGMPLNRSFYKSTYVETITKIGVRYVLPNDGGEIEGAA